MAASTLHALVDNTLTGKSMYLGLLTWQHFLLRGFSRGQISRAASNPRTRDLASRELHPETFYFLFFIFHLVRHTNRRHPLPCLEH